MKLINPRTVGIDLGSSQTRLFIKKSSPAAEQPSIVAIDKSTQKVTAIGSQAWEMAGRTPESIKIVKPIKHGVIADYGKTKVLLSNILNNSLGTLRVFRPNVVINVSLTATSTEKRAITELAYELGAKSVTVVPSPVAAAIGANIPITEPAGHMVIDIGAGTSEIVVMSMGGIVSKGAVRIGGDEIDEAIIRHLKRAFGISIGSSTASDIKRIIGSLEKESSQKTMSVSGRSVAENLPKTLKLRSDDIKTVIATIADEVVQVAKQVLEQTPAELVSDIKQHGIILVGGVARLKGLDDYLSDKLNTSCIVSPRPTLACGRGSYVLSTVASKSNLTLS